MNPTTDNDVQPDTNGGDIQTSDTASSGGFDFSAALNAEFSNHPSIQKFNGDVNNLAKSYLSLEQMMGQGRVTIPKDADDAVAWEAYDKAFNVPDAQKYGLTADDENLDMEAFCTLMKKHHIGKEAAQDILNNYLDYTADVQQMRQQEVEAQMNETTAALKKEWGAAYAQNLKLAGNTLAKFCDTKDDYVHMEGLIGNDIAAIKILHKIGSAISEGTLGGFEGQVAGFAKTPAEAKTEFEKIMADPDDAYWAGSRNRRNDMKWCKQNNAHYVSEDARLARVQYVQSLLKMQG